MSTLSVVVSAYNEEKMIGDCLKSVTWADEIIVVDNESTDKTKEISLSYGARVITQPNRLMLNTNKNKGFQEAKSSWILNIDADERIPSSLQELIKKTIRADVKANGFSIPRKNIIFGKWIQYGLWWPDYQIRLFRNGKGKFPCVHVHEYITVDGSTELLSEPMIHENYQTISQYVRKLDSIYTKNEVEHKLKNGYVFHWYDVIRIPLSDFLSVYFLRKGYKDGLHGLVLGLFQGFYAFIVTIKCWEKLGFPEKNITSQEIEKELNKSSREFSYWKLTQTINETNNSFHRFITKMKRKLR